MLGLHKNQQTSVTNITLFAQIARLIPRFLVDAATKQHNSNKGVSRLNVWTHLLSMVFCHLGNCLSLRDITNGLRSAGGNLNHLGMDYAPSRNALSYQNAHRGWEVWKTLYKKLHDYLGQQVWKGTCGKKIAGIGKRSVYLLDSTLITLCAKVFDWAHYSHEKGAVKMHTLFSLNEFLPALVHISDGKMGDNIGAYYALPPRGSVLVADRGYCDTALLRDWDSNGICFVIRLRQDIHFKSLGEFDQPDDTEQDILVDEAIQFTGEEPSRNYPNPIRRIVVYDPKTMQEPIELLTNARWSAGTVAELYRSRWNIEIFFKTIKQLLRVKSFVGTSANAVYTQLWTALIAVLLLRILKTKAKYSWHMSNLVSFLRLNLFNKIDLWKWVNDPFEKRPPPRKAYEPGLLL